MPRIDVAGHLGFLQLTARHARTFLLDKFSMRLAHYAPADQDSVAVPADPSDARLISSLVSICIPAWERPQLVLQTVQSCLNQTYADIEILITDDSLSDDVQSALAHLCTDPRVRYIRNEQRLGQAANVNKLFTLARGERLVLLHDDDLLLPDAIEILARCWAGRASLIASYGKHYVITHSGKILRGVSAAANRTRYRTAQHAGLQRNALWSVLACQLPPDAFMVRTVAARALLYRDCDAVGDACDVDFALRLATSFGSFFFVDRYVSKYRITDISVSTESSTVSHRYLLVRSLQISGELEPMRQRYLESAASPAIRRYLMHGERGLAWRLMRGKDQSLGATLARVKVSDLVLLTLPTSFVRAIGAIRHFMRIHLRRNNAVYRLRDVMYRYRERLTRT